MLGAAVPIRLVLARTGNVVVAITNGTAYPTGFQFTVDVRCREPQWGNDPFEMPFHPRRRGKASSKELRLGIQLSDGRKATSLDGFPRPREESSGPVLVQGGGGGGGRSWTWRFWLYPLPPAGPLAFVCEWPAEDIELTRHEIDAGLVREAGERADVLWEEQSGASSRWTTYGR